jgi:hypothetical protein
LPKVKKKEKKKKKKKRIIIKKVFLYVLKVLCWKSLKSKEIKHWWLKMKNLCFDGISCLKYHFSECSTFFGLNLSIYFFFPHLNLSPITTRK